MGRCNARLGPRIAALVFKLKYGSRLVAKCRAVWYEIFRLVDDGPIGNKNIATELPTTRPERLIHPGSIKAIRIDVDLLVCGSSWIICLSAPVRGLPRRKNLFSSVCMRHLQINILGRVRPVGVLPLQTP